MKPHPGDLPLPPPFLSYDDVDDDDDDFNPPSRDRRSRETVRPRKLSARREIRDIRWIVVGAKAFSQFGQQATGPQATERFRNQTGVKDDEYHAYHGP